MLSLALLSHSASAGNGTSESPVERIQRVFRFEPQTLTAGGYFSFSPTGVIASYQGVLAQMRPLEEYQRLIAARARPVRVQIHVESSVAQKTYRLDPYALGNWKSKVGSAVSSFYGYPTTTILSKLRSFVTAHAKIPRDTFMQLAAEAQALAIAEDIIANEWDGKTREGGMLDAIRSRIAKLGEAEVDWFNEPASMRPLLATGLSADTIEQVLPVLHQYSEMLGNSMVAVADESFKGLLTVTEVPPEVGLFRGAIGEDCSTTFSANYAASPGEHTYYIYSETGNALAFMNGTEVMFNGAPALYINTIDGRHLSTPQTDAVLRAMYAIRESLGVHEIVLPVGFKLNGNINHFGVRKAFLDAIQGGLEGRLEYKDANIRTYIDRTHSSTPYDRADTNTSAILYAPKPINTKLNYTQSFLTESEMSLDAQPLTKWDAMAIAAKMIADGRDAKMTVAYQVMQPQGISHADLRHFAEWVANTARQPLASYQETVRTELRALGVEFTPAFLAGPGHILSGGYQNCPDTPTPSAEHRNQSEICNLLL